ncbi:MAG: 1-(5-phosphoribosyl)-5-[(5-phosphoribosylamino)methylideneamino]imidazole-4-carboxamide isomerase [Planctomycetes bacterium]|nr:1-(5-phosphoribosyl)-5-[(5-phosphoribosylamino)methylideneamino]imidazole-4-carboxamide isomerase [Planctomycetota bacterium]
MIIFPAIDILQGRCVRMVGGVVGTERLISNDPVAVARDWEVRGAQGLHVVDLDAAFERGDNRGIVKEILQHAKIPVQVGGGIRTAEQIRELLLLGASRVIVGTKGVLDQEWLRLRCKDFPERLILALDARGEDVVVRGWRQRAKHGLQELARQVDDMGLSGILYTNVSVEGKAQGISWEPVERLVRATTLPVIYSGGVIAVEEVRRLREIGVTGVVLGTALYFGGIDFEDALAAAAGQEVQAAATTGVSDLPEDDRATKTYRRPTEMEVRVAEGDVPASLRTRDAAGPDPDATEVDSPGAYTPQPPTAVSEPVRPASPAGLASPASPAAKRAPSRPAVSPPTAVVSTPKAPAAGAKPKAGAKRVEKKKSAAKRAPARAKRPKAGKKPAVKSKAKRVTKAARPARRGKSRKS